MGETSIEWTLYRPDGTTTVGYTFNPWLGCTKVSDGCKLCYAAEMDAWLSAGVHWGADAPRKFFGEEHWRRPLKWNRDAARAGERRKVFCASVADVFEDRRDLDEWRLTLLQLINATPWLDWLLVTKRPDVMRRWFEEHVPERLPNVWVGATVENQAQEWRIGELLQVDAVAHFLSVEPMLGPVDLDPPHCQHCSPEREELGQADDGTPWCMTCDSEACFGWYLGDAESRVDWVICGGESDKRGRARPMDEAWVRELRDQCAREEVPFFYKQRPENGGRRKVSLPMLDGVRHVGVPDPEVA